MHLLRRLPASRRRVGSDGENLSCRQGHFQFLKQLQEINVTTGQWFNIQMDAGKSRMRLKKFPHRAKEHCAPLGITIPNTAAIRPADPWHHPEAGKFIQKHFRLICVQSWNRALNVRRAKVREYIRDVMRPEFCGKRSNLVSATVSRQFVGLFVADKPRIITKPAVRNPDAVLASIMPSVAHINSW